MGEELKAKFAKAVSLTALFLVVGANFSFSAYGSIRFLAQKDSLLLIADQCQSRPRDQQSERSTHPYCDELRRAALRAIENGADPEKVEALVNIFLN